MSRFFWYANVLFRLTCNSPFVFRKVVEYFGNMVKNYDEDCFDNDFFDIIRNNFDHDKAVELIEVAFTLEEIDEMRKRKMHRDRLDLEDTLDDVFRAIWNNENAREKCRIVLESICECMTEGSSRGLAEDPIYVRFNRLKEVLRLDELEAEIALFNYVRTQTCFEWPRRVEDREKPLMCAMAIDRSYGEVMKATSPTGRLRKFGVLDYNWDFNSRLYESFMRGCEEEAIERRYYKKGAQKDVLPWDFYGDLSAKDGEIIKDMITQSKGGKNILLYGAPGTGKTSFARSLARELGLTPFEIKQGGNNNDDMKSESRMIGIKICNEHEDAARSLMIIDEADEILRNGSFDYYGGWTYYRGKSTEKGITNTILDEMKMPAIWICNASAESMDESVRRRFDYSVCFERLTNEQRMSIWRNLIKRYGLGKSIGEDKVQDYAQKYETSAGGIAVVLENIKRMKVRANKMDDMIAKLMNPHCKLMGVTETNRFLPAKGYSLDGLNIKGKVKLDRVVGAVRNYLDTQYNAASEDRPRMNILMYGAPGTGKTEFVKYLGKTLDRKVLVKKASDILDMYVGNTEKRIAAAFRQAEAEHAILFFDEIDGLVQDREGAKQSWEVTQVNELLQQMENFSGVMIAATNFSKNLDAAIMRRFTFKLEFDYLDDNGKKLFFERMFKTELKPDEFAELKQLTNLAPGDFRTVRQEQFYLGGEQTNLDRIAALKEECAIKKDGNGLAKIGFGA